MAKINFGNRVNLSEAAKLIAACPENRFSLEGEPGIGKSSLMGTISKMVGSHYSVAYIDVPNMDLGDIAMPVVHHESRTTMYYPNSRFKLHEKDENGDPKPVIIMLDEFGKGAEPVKNMLHPLLEVTNPRLGDVPLPPGSIVFTTSNLSTDGVGDNIKAHSRNRLTRLQVAKPTADEWIDWAVSQGIIEGSVIAWVKQTPYCLESYLDASQEKNPYIYNPKQVQQAFVSPRSLHRASFIVAQRKSFSSDSLIHALTGTIGEAAARDMQAFIDYQDQLPPWRDILERPAKVAVPSSPGACAVLVYGALSRVDGDSINPFTEYLDRFQEEWQAVFAINAIKSPRANEHLLGCKWYENWMRSHQDML